MSRHDRELPDLLITMTEGCEDVAVGKMESIFRTDDLAYVICNLDVEPDYRQQGIGKIMLQLAKLEAAKVGAKAIRASLISREAVQAAISVFGVDSVDVTSIGTFNPPQPGSGDIYDASARLSYKLDSSKT